MNVDPVVIYHNNCSDGFAAAWIAQVHFKPIAPVFIEVNYGDNFDRIPERIKDKDVFVLDFAFKRPLMEEFNALAKSFVVLDHHKTSQEDCLGLTYCTFDMTKSGAMLAWEYFNPGKAAPPLIKYVQDRDLWRWELPNSQEINAVVQSYDYRFEIYQELNSRLLSEIGIDNMVKEGKTILRLEAKAIASAAKYPMMMWIGGHCVPVINNPILISKTVESLCADRVFAAAFFLRQDGKWQFSLRSRAPKGIDVADIAKQYGGGGHPAAAGFELPFDRLAELFKTPQG